MQMQIWKFVVRPGAFVEEMPEGAKLLSVQFQPGSGEPQMWALVDLLREKVKHRFVSVGTGQSLPAEINDFAFVGTFQLPNGLVFHLFDAGEET